MYIQNFQLQNISCFDKLTLDLSQAHSNKPCKWVVLLGENGTGKSTVLQMMALSLLGRDLVREIMGGLDWKNLIRSSAIKGRVEIALSATKEDKKRRRNADNHYLAAFNLGSTIKTGLDQDDKISTEDYKMLDTTLYAENLELGWFASGYGAWRRLPHHKFTSRSGPDLVASSAKAHRFVSMFDQELALTRVTDWLVDLEFRKLKEPENVASQRAFTLATNAIEKTLPGIKFKEITANQDVIFDDNGVAVPINRLSDGYRGTMAWIGDLVRRLVEAFPKMENPLKASGVVLVDEIDIHLHPKWQRSIVEQVRELFPNIQFIVSSHSPFVAQDMTTEDKIIVFKKKGDAVTISEREGDIKGWRVDQILTSYLFDLETTRDISIVTAEKKYQELLDKQTTNQFTAKDKKKMKELKEWIENNKSMPGESIEENELYGTAKSLIDILDEYLSR